jgi:YfiH family protein
VSIDPGVVLTVRVADCVPLLIADRATGAVAAVHAGWRGTCAGIAQRAVAALTRGFGSRPQDLSAALGPSIGPCCYETGPSVREALKRAGWPADATEAWFQGPAGRHFDLWRANAEQLIRAGVDPESVFVCGLCTADHPGWFHSYRRDGERAGRLAGYIRAADSR